MCDTYSNLPRAVRNRVQMPCGTVASFSELEQRFSAVPRDQRAQLSRKLLSGICEDDREHLKNWAEVQVKKPYSIPESMFHLMVFYIVAFIAKVPEMVQATVDAIVGKGTIVGVIVPA